MAGPKNTVFDIRGINHLALVCKDMARTVDFYTNVLGMPLIKTIDLPFGMGQHFFFDIGNGDSLAFFWFPDAPAARRRALVGRARLAGRQGLGPRAWFDEPCRDQRTEPTRSTNITTSSSRKGVKCTRIFNHDEFEYQASLEHYADDVRALDLFLRSRRHLPRIRSMDAHHSIPRST